jgi:hypothetical protein
MGHATYMEEMRSSYGILVGENLKERSNFGKLGIARGIVLKQILEK